MNNYLAHVAPGLPVQDVLSITMMRDGLYVHGEMLDYWQHAFPNSGVSDLYKFVAFDVDDEDAHFTRSVAWRGPEWPM
jgi:hypothetical protein